MSRSLINELHPLKDVTYRELFPYYECSVFHLMKLCCIKNKLQDKQSEEVIGLTNNELTDIIERDEDLSMRKQFLEHSKLNLDRFIG